MKALPHSVRTRCKDSRVRFADVGASGGLPTVWKAHADDIDVIGYEPDENAFAELERRARPNEKWFNIGLHRSAGPVDFFITQKQTCSSCLKPNMALLEHFPDHERFEIREETTIRCAPLDGVLSDAGVAEVDFLKIDTQGSELAVLEGAEVLLRDSLFGLEVEVWFVEGYLGVPMHAQIDVFLRERGFDLIDLRTVTWQRKLDLELGAAKGQLIFADALYFKSIDGLRANLLRGNGADRLLRALGVCLIYGYVDYALAILAGCAADHFEAAEIHDLEAYVQAHEVPGAAIPRFFGRKKLSALALRLHELLAPHRYRHSQPRLGNRLRKR